MAVVLENSQLVWQKVKNALANATPATQDAFQGLRKYLSTQGRNPDLQFIAYSEAQAIASAGTDLTGAACKVYGWYGKASRTDQIGSGCCERISLIVFDELKIGITPLSREVFTKSLK